MIFLVNDEFRDDWIVVVSYYLQIRKEPTSNEDAGSCIMTVSAAKLYLSQYYHSTIWINMIQYDALVHYVIDSRYCRHIIIVIVCMSISCIIGIRIERYGAV